MSEIENKSDLVSIEEQSEKPIKIRRKITHIPRRDYSWHGSQNFSCKKTNVKTYQRNLLW